MRPRLGLTTSADRIESLTETVEGAGLQPVALPCIEVSAADRPVLDSARQIAADCDWLVVTSSRTVDALWPEGGMPEVATATVGPATAAAVESAGGSPRIVGTGGASDLFRALAGLVGETFVFFPHGASADLASLRHLESVATRVETSAVYETSPVSPDADEVEAVVFGSPSAVTGWFQTRDVSGLAVGAIGLTTERALEERGVVGAIVPERPSFRRLVALLAAHLGERSVV